MKFKLITYNIWHGKHFEKVATFLQNEGAEIVCTQEMATKGRDFGHEDIDLLRELETRLHMPGIYERMAWGDNGRGKYDIGVAIFNKYKILDRVT